MHPKVTSQLAALEARLLLPGLKFLDMESTQAVISSKTLPVTSNSLDNEDTDKSVPATAAAEKPDKLRKRRKWKKFMTERDVVSELCVTVKILKLINPAGPFTRTIYESVEIPLFLKLKTLFVLFRTVSDVAKIPGHC